MIGIVSDGLWQHDTPQGIPIPPFSWACTLMIWTGLPSDMPPTGARTFATYSHERRTETWSRVG